jgi:hypothetical protein
MNVNNRNTGKIGLPLLFAAVLFVSFFLPWVSWDGILIKGYDMPAGKFFRIAETNFGLGNPFPQFSFTFLVFWLIPALLVSSFIQASRKKIFLWPAVIAAALALSLATVFYLFTGVLVELGVGSSAIKAVQPSLCIAVISAIGLILTVLPRNAWLKKPAWILAGPLFAFLGFMLIQGYIKNEKFSDSSNVKADFTLNAPDLLREFTTNDSAANKKYQEKMLEISGNASSVEILGDSTSTIKFADSSGSYAIFSLEKDQVEKVKKISNGDPVTLKGVCSGSIFSERHATTSIRIKRSTINK